MMWSLQAVFCKSVLFFSTPVFHKMKTSERSRTRWFSFKPKAKGLGIFGKHVKNQFHLF